MKENHSLSLALINLHLFLCRHLLTNSVRLFNRVSSLAVKIAYFFARQRCILCPVLVRCCVANYFLRYNRIYTRIFAGPNKFGKFGWISFGIRIEGMVGIVKSCFKNSATAVPPIWQTSSQLTTRGFLSPTMANQNLNPVIADISRHAH